MEVTIENLTDPSWIQLEIDKILAKKREELERKLFLEAALESDEALERWIKDHFWSLRPPIVRASTYKIVSFYQEIGVFARDKDPRRPVIMKGSKELLRRRRAAHAQELAERYLRRYKITWKYGSQIPKCVRDMEIKIFNKLNLHWNQRPNIHPLREYKHWVKGVLVDIPKVVSAKSRPIERQKQYVKQLQSARVIVPSVRLPKRDELDKWRAAYDALTELGINI